VSLLTLLVPVGADWYALDMASVREVVAFPLLTRVPTAPAALLGLFNLRGEIVPLFDTAALLDAGRMAGVASFAVVVLTDGEDTDSSNSAEEVARRLGAQGDSASRVRVFTIAYRRSCVWPPSVSSSSSWNGLAPTRSWSPRSFGTRTRSRARRRWLASMTSPGWRMPWRTSSNS